jgi:hypothetical protein
MRRSEEFHHLVCPTLGGQLTRQQRDALPGVCAQRLKIDGLSQLGLGAFVVTSPSRGQAAWCPGPGTPARTPLDVRPPLQAFGLGGVAGHPKGAIGRQRLIEQLSGFLLVSSATTVEQHPGSQAA